MVFTAEGFLDRPVTDGLQFSMPRRVQLFSSDLFAATGVLPNPEFTISPELLLGGKPPRRLDVRVEGMSTDRTDSWYFLKFLSL